MASHGFMPSASYLQIEDVRASMSFSGSQTPVGTFPSFSGYFLVNYVNKLHNLLAQQSRAADRIQNMLDSIASDVLSLDANSQPWDIPSRFVLKRFGSRLHGACLSSSDVDIVCEVPVNVRTTWRTPFLRKVLAALRTHHCTSIRDQIEHKKTVGFKQFGLACDFTINEGCVLQRHRPSQLSNNMMDALDARPPLVRDILMMVIDVCKQFNICHTGKKKIVHLKAVHIALLVLAWWDTNTPDDSCMLTLLRDFSRG